MKKFTFILNERLAKKDPSGPSNHYTGEKHPENENYVIVSFRFEEKKDSVTYPVDRVQKLIKEGR